MVEMRMSLAALRVRAGYSQGEAALKLEISRETLAKWERDSTAMPVSYIKRFEELYGYPQDNMYFGNAQQLSNRIQASSKC